LIDIERIHKKQLPLPTLYSLEWIGFEDMKVQVGFFSLKIVCEWYGKEKYSLQLEIVPFCSRTRAFS